MSKIHIYIFVSMYVSNTHVCIYVYIFVNMYVKNTYIHTHILACMNTCIHACMHSYIHSFITYLTLHCIENYISLHTSRNIMEYLVCVYIYVLCIYRDIIKTYYSMEFIIKMSRVRPACFARRSSWP